MANAAAAVLLVGALLGLVSASLADQGTASYSIASGLPPACIIGNLGEGTMTTAVTCTGAANAAVANPCNAGARVTVTVVDLCPSPGCTVTFDLSQQAFSTIASLDAGEILIDYQLA
nr:unnamed protein product [Digitaria exilis]